DSFSDGGRYLDREAAIAHGIRMVDEGADIVDVGGESTRPGSDPVPAAQAALAAGATIVNDVAAGADPDMFPVVREAGAGLVLMHMLGDPKTMQIEPRYDDVVAEVKAFLRGRLEVAELAGIEPDRLCVDPGIGFGKTLEHNLALLHHLDELLELGRPLLVGPSRKRF